MLGLERAAAGLDPRVRTVESFAAADGTFEPVLPGAYYGQTLEVPATVVLPLPSGEYYQQDVLRQMRRRVRGPASPVPLLRRD